jgi:hypothetical protein
MNLSAQEQVENTVNVVSLFGRMNKEVVIENDPLSDLIKESEIPDMDEVIMAAPAKLRKVVSADQFPDQSIYVLEEQLSNLRSSMNRIKFYLGDLDDLLPR